MIGANVLQNVPIFKSMNNSERSQVAEYASVLEFKAGDVVLEQGQKSQDLWIVLEGKCEVVREQERKEPGSAPARTDKVLLAVLEPFSNFGEMSFFHPAPHSASVRAVTQVKLLRIERADYNELVAEGSSAAYKLACNAVDCLAERLRRMGDWVAGLIQEGRAASESPEPASEWHRFRERLFNGWNL